MDKKKWSDKLAGLKKLKGVAKFHKEKATDDIEELELMISAIQNKIKSFK